MANERLRAVMGLGSDTSTLMAEPEPQGPLQELSETVLTDVALAGRPDVRAAELLMEAAAERAGWERSRVLGLTAMLDANGEGEEGFEVGPGFQAEIPLFNRNQAGRARAQAGIERAAWQYLAARQRVLLEVREATFQYAQSGEALGILRARILPTLQANVQRAERAFDLGEASYAAVLEAGRRGIEARFREAELAARLERAAAQLERSLGGQRVHAL
jgi:cobalt-zinc-cadmium efflux system outer membrane protein